MPRTAAVQGVLSAFLGRLRLEVSVAPCRGQRHLRPSLHLFVEALPCSPQFFRYGHVRVTGRVATAIVAASALRQVSVVRIWVIEAAEAQAHAVCIGVAEAAAQPRLALKHQQEGVLLHAKRATRI